MSINQIIKSLNEDIERLSKKRDAARLSSNHTEFNHYSGRIHQAKITLELLNASPE